MAFSCARPRSTIPAPIPFLLPSAMNTLKTNLNARSAEFRINAGAMSALVDDLRAKIDQVAAGGGEAARAKHVAARQAAAARARATPCSTAGSPFLELSQLAALDMYDNEAPCAGIITGIGRMLGQDCMVVVQRRHGERRHLLPDDGEKAPARAGNRGAEQPALHLPGGFGRRQPAHQDEVFPDRDHFGRIFYNQANMSAAGHPADRGGDGLVHRRRRLCAGDVRRDRHRQGPGHDFPGRAAAGEGRHRRDRHAPRTSAAPRCTRAMSGRRRPLRGERRARAVASPAPSSATSTG